MSSYQKTKLEYERIKEERARKREEFLKDKAQREEALKKYKENLNISAVEKQNQEGSAQPQSAYGAIAAKDSSSAQIIQYYP
ncbi:thyroid transcription factor 1-associated 26-like protein [Labeo rohita]|uniref:Thyroid transcription factor 1-associated 26-like protein n=1 Tax=Labeo rohita TaxID=84645 RepID=A0A498NQ80_LABRO|nr:thyroid transcription factor 1-associated 26-like protein [Labeo rohita]